MKTNILANLDAFATAMLQAAEAAQRFALAWQANHPAKDPSMIESQRLVLRKIAEQPGSAILYEPHPRAGRQPLRFRTIRRLIELGYLSIHQSDQNNDLYLTLTVEGWDRVAKMDKQ